MHQITGISIDELLLPLTDDDDAPFLVRRISGLNDLVYSLAEADAGRVSTAGGGRDLAIVLAIRPGTDYFMVRRDVAAAVRIQSEVTVTVFLDDAPYAQTVCVVRNVSADISGERPTISIDLESSYTCLTLIDEVVITDLPFGMDAQLPAVTHDFTPVKVVMSITTPMALWYRIAISSDWLVLHTPKLKTNYGIDGVPEGSLIIIDSDPEKFSINLHMPAEDQESPDTIVNIETACDIGSGGFRFIPNEPMMVRTQKLPSGISGETVFLSCLPRLSGV